MPTLGRNDPCPCGSGKKFKKCCWEKRKDFLQTGFSPSWVQSPSKLGELTEIPSVPLRDLSPEKLSRNLSKIKQFCTKTNFAPKSLSEKVFFDNFSQFSASKYLIKEPFILAPEIYQEALNRNYFPYCRLIYFNEIDQYFYSYKVRTFSFFSDTLNRIIRHFDDFIVLSCISRQLIELVYFSITNQWVFISSYNTFLRSLQDLTQKMSPGMVGDIKFKELEEFVLSLNFWTRESLSELYCLTGIKMGHLDNDAYKIEDYQPSTFLQSSILKYLAKHSGSKGALDFTIDDEINQLDQAYRFFCKFVHPNSQLLPPVYKADTSLETVKFGVQKMSLECVDGCLSLFKKFFQDQRFYNVRFDKLLYKFLPSYCAMDAQTILLKDAQILKGIKEKFKGMTIETNAGPEMIVPGLNTSRRANKLGAMFDKLSDEEKSEVEKFTRRFVCIE